MTDKRYMGGTDDASTHLEADDMVGGILRSARSFCSAWRSSRCGWFSMWPVLFRRSTFNVSLGTMLLGLTEPAFVPTYWNPPTLWNLARQTGFT